MRRRVLILGLVLVAAAAGAAGVIAATNSPTRARANMLLDGSRVDTDQPTYVLVVEGDFVAVNAPRPAGTPAPDGSVVTMVIDPSIGGVLDFGLRNSIPDLTALGLGADLGLSG